MAAFRGHVPGTVPGTRRRAAPRPPCSNRPHSGYEIRITRLHNDAGATAAAFAGRIITEGRSVVVPPGMMASDQSYFIQVIAFREGDADIATEPLATRYPRAPASVLSGAITP